MFLSSKFIYFAILIPRVKVWAVVKYCRNGISICQTEGVFLYNKVEGKVALQIETNKCFDCVIFESNYQHVVNDILNGCNYENELETLLSSCRSLL